MALLLAPLAAFGQSVDVTTYPFSSGSGATLEDMSSGTTQLIGPNVDNATSTVVETGFEFWFAGTRYTSFSLTSDGLLRLGPTVVQNAPTNDLTTVVNAPQIAPYWDNLWVGTNGKVHYKVVGATPSRKLVIEWLNLQVPRVAAGFAGAGTFQCWLHETTGRIEFVYGGGLGTNTVQSGASLGIGAIDGTFASVSVVSNSISYASANNSNVVPIASGTSYAFTPPLPSAPGGLLFTQVGPLGMTLNWTDLASNETGYAIWRSEDGVNFTFVTQTAANATSSAQSGLTPGIAYSWIVRAVSSGALSAALPGSQATSTAGTIVTTGSGAWSSTTPDAPWPGGVVPGASSLVTIADGHTVTVDAAATCYHLTVGQGASGALVFESATARTLTVVTDVVVAAGATLASAASGTQTGHVLSLGGDLINHGTLDFSTNGDLAGAALSFTGASNESLTGDGPVIDVRAITVAKTAAGSLTLDAASFSVQGQTSNAPGFLTLSSGTFRIGGTFAMSGAVFATAAYSLPTGTIFWLDNPNVVVTGQAASPTVRGLRVSAGQFQVGTASGHSLQLANGSTITIEGGEVRIAGRFAVSSTSNTVSYLQTGGTVTVNTAGNTSTSFASFDLGTGSGSSVTISGGSIVLQSASTATSGPRDYRNAAATQTITGGALQIGNASSGAPQTFWLSGSVPPLTIGNQVGGHTVRLSGAATVVGATAITPGATLDLNGVRFTQSSGSLVNDGTIAASTGSSELYFLGSAAPQTYSGAGSVSGPIVALSADNPSGVSIDPALAVNLVARRVNLIRGVLGNSNKVTLGNADSVVAVTQVGETGVTGAAGAYDGSPLFNPGSGGLTVVYAQAGTPRNTGFEIPSSRSLTGITVNNPGGVVVVSGGAVTVTKSLTLTSGLLRTTASDGVVIADTATTVPAGSSQSYVDGPLSIAVTTSTPGSRTFAVGRNGAFRPLVLSSLNTGGIQRVFTTEVIAGPTGGTATSPLTSLAVTRYWSIGNSAGLNATARVQLAFGTDDNVGTLANLRVAQSSTANGAYASLGGSASGSQSSGTVTSNTNLVPGSGYFAIGTVGTLASTWDGGAGTTNWGDAANWSPDGVPGAGTDVTLSLPAPATLQVAGSFSVNNITVNGNTTIQLASGTLAVNGTFTQFSGLVTGSGGSIQVTGTSTFSGGTFTLGAGTFTATGAVTISGGAVSLSSGTFLSSSSLTINSGSLSQNTGVLEARGNLTINGGNFFAGSGTTLLSGTSTQTIGAGFTYHNLVLRNGGTGQPKRFASVFAHIVNNDLIVESTAQMALSTSDATPFTVWGNLRYSGLTGGTSISSLTINLAGVGKVLSGVEPPGPTMESVTLSSDAAPEVPTVEVNLLTDPTRARRTGREQDGKPVIELENTFEKKRGQVEQLFQTRDRKKRLVVNLDDMTLVQEPDAGSLQTLATPTTSLPMPVTVVPDASYALDGNVTMSSGRTLTVSGRLEASTYTVGGAGAVSVRGLGTLATTTASAAGLGGTVVTTGTNTYLDGSTIEYNRAGDQTIHAGNHPAASLIRTAGSGTKTLTASKTITGSSGGLLDKGALFVGSGTTFADGGNRLSLTSPLFANVVVQGGYLSTGSGSLSFEAGSFNSNMLAVDGTAFGDLLMNFASSTQTIDLNASGIANLSFRNVTCGGTAGSGTAGGTLRLSETGTTNLSVTGDVSLAPTTTSNSGGGFGGTAGKNGLITLLGNLTSTSTSAVQPLVNDVGVNTLRLGGGSPQTLTLASGATILTGATLDVANSGGLTLGGPGVVYAVGSGGSARLNGRNVVAGSNTLALNTGATLDAGGGRIIGRLRKPVPTGAPSLAFEIGTATDPTPVALGFTNVTAPGDVTVRSELGEHPQIATSGIDATKSLNLHYFLDGAGIAFNACDADFQFPAGAVDAAANPASFIVRKHDGSSWSKVTAANQTPTSIRGAGVTSLGSFAFGEQQFIPVTASAGTNGTVSPDGVTQVPYGDSLVVTFTPAAGYHVAEVLLDGVPVGAPSTYTFQSVVAPHTIAASFALNVYTLTASAGFGGAISPSGAVPVNHGASQAFTITPNPGFYVTGVQVDGSPVGAVTSYSFENVTGDHTISATFIATDVMISVVAPPTAISTAHPCVTTPVRVQRTSTTPIRAFSVRFTLPPQLTLCSGIASVTEGTFLNSFGTTYYNVVDRGGGTYQVDCSILGANCGPDTTQGTLFQIALTSTEPFATATVTLDSLKFRDCANQSVVVVGGQPPVIPIDNTPPTVSLLFPNGGEVVTIGSTAAIAWNSSDQAGAGTVDLSYSTDGGLTFPNVIANAVPDSGSYAWTVPNDRQTDARIRIVVHDPNENAASDASDASFEIREANVPPVLGAIGNQTVDEGTLLTFTASASDPNLPPQARTFSLDTGAPAGATIDSGTGVFAWTPTEAQGPGDYPVTVRVTDNGTPSLDDFETLSIHVGELNQAPVLSDVPASASVPEQALYSFTATRSDADLPAQTLTFSLVGAPAGASIDPGTGVFTWTPTEAQGPGSYPFTVRLSDGVANTDVPSTLTVQDSNVPPVLAAIGNRTVNEGALLTFTASATDTDLPTQALTFSLDAGAPSGATIDSGSGVFTWTPTEAQGPGNYSVTVRVTDNGTPPLDDFENISIQVAEVNMPPILTNVPTMATIAELVLFSFAATASDADVPGQNLSFSTIGAPVGASIDPGTGVFTWTPTEAQGPGTYPFTVRLSDGVANTDVAVTLTVQDENSAPVLAAIGNQTINEAALFTFTASASDSDVPTQTLTFSLDGGAPSGASIDPGSGVFTWTPTEAQGPGDYPVTVRVTDNGTPPLDDFETFSIHVNDVNQPPVLTNVPGSATIAELVLYTFTATGADADLPAQSLTFSLVGAPSGASIDPGTGVFTWTPTEAQGPGSYPFTVRLNDGVANTDAAITLTVQDVNSAPVLAAIGNQTINEAALFTFTASASDTDVPAQTLTFSLDAGAPSGASIDPGSGVFTWTPTEAQGPGDYSVTVRVTDNGAPPLDDFETFSIHVNDVNQPPMLSNVPATATIAELVLYTFTATGADTDLPAQTLTFSLVGAPVGASIDPGSGVFTWTPTEAQGPGSYPFTVRLGDGVANTDVAVTLTVQDVDIPAIADLAATQMKSGNDTDGTTAITLGWTPPGSGTVEVYRAPFGAYPEYDDGGGLVPATPTYPPGAPWVLTSVATPGANDEPSTRDYYYYVAFVHGAGANVSAASNVSAALDYHLGDVSDGVTAGQGNNTVDIADISLLGAHYGLAGAAVAPYAYLDVGPTSDYSVDSRPMTDDQIEFEDLVMFAINFEAVSGPTTPTGPQNAQEVLTLAAPGQVVANQNYDATLSLAGTGGVQAISVVLTWNPAIVEPVVSNGSANLASQGGVAFSVAPGTLDAALLGAREVGLTGQFGTISFHALASGDPEISVQLVRARNASNQPVTITTSGPVDVPPIELPRTTSFRGGHPNPFRETATFEFTLATTGTVDLGIYGVDGRRVKTLASGTHEPGFVHFRWDGRDDAGRRVPPGVYYARLQTPQGSFSRSIVHVK